MPKLKLTPWGEFVMRYSVMVPPKLWQEIRQHLQHFMDTEQDWKFFAGEMEAGLHALTNDEATDSFYRIVALEENNGL